MTSVACLFRGHRWTAWERGVKIHWFLAGRTEIGDVRFCERCKARDIRV